MSEKKGNWKETNPEENERGYVELMFQHPECVDDQHWYKATVRHDGCIHFYRAYNEPFTNKLGIRHTNQDYIHVCDIDEYIDILQKLKKTAVKYFAKHGRKWG
ncbi:hypothetical protein KW791_00025 [Candidatus Parcubacteria bacterium]|nr:hypothetical protein [Candidatus Parcubacteria bacterium]